MGFSAAISPEQKCNTILDIAERKHIPTKIVNLHDMAQALNRESRRTLLSIEQFWERATEEPTIQWEKWLVQVKLAILARENITLDSLLEPKTSKVKLPPDRNMKHQSKMKTNSCKRTDRKI